VSNPENTETGAQVELQEPEVKFPVDIRTLLIGIGARAHVLVIFVIFSLLAGLGGAKMFGHKEFETSTVLLYKPPAGAGPESDGNTTPSLLTQVEMVKIPSNLETTRRRLKLKSSIEKLNGAIKAEVPINSSLMEITVTWNSAQQAADIANTVRDVFLEDQLSIQHNDAGNQIRDLESRLVKVQGELHIAEQNLKDYTVKNHVVDPDKEAGWYLQQLINTELVYEQAIGDDKAAQLQQANIGKLVADLQVKARNEEQLVSSGVQFMPPKGGSENASTNAIQGRVAVLRLKEIEMERAKALVDEGVYSQREYDKAKADYESEKFNLYNNSPSAGLLKEMTMRELDVKLASISDELKVAHLKEAVNHVREKLDALPLVQRDYVALQREVAIRAAERERIDQFLGLARRQNESQSFGFSVVSTAKPPVLPMHSNRKMVFIAILFMGTFFGFLVVVGMELADRRVRSIGDARAKLKAEVLAGFPHGDLRSTGSRDNALMLISKLRAGGLNPGSRILVVSPTPGEGAPEIALQLGRTFASSGDTVLLVDAQFRRPAVRQSSGPEAAGLRKKIEFLKTLFQSRIVMPKLSESEESLSAETGLQDSMGLSDLIAGESNEACAALEIDHKMRLVPAGRSARPELLLFQHLGEVITRCEMPGDLTFMHTASMLDHPDATFMASAVQNALIVVSAGKVKAARIDECAAKLEGAGMKVLGVVVTNIADAYVERNAA